MIRKAFALGLLLVCLPALSHAKGDRKPLQVYDYSKGADTYHDPKTLPDGFVQDSLNVLFDDRAPVTKRFGYTTSWSTKTYSFTGLWTYTDATNTTWQIARSSDQITASDLAGHIVKVSTVASSNLIGQANAFGNSYFVDQTQGVYYWNGSSTTYIAGSPKGSIIAQFHNRLWVSGLAVPNGNQLYGSKYYDASTWTTGLNATDPVQYSVGLQDNFDNVTAEYVYLDTLYLFKHYTIFALYGFDQTNFQISQLTQECGCIDGNSIQTYNGGLKFMSLRGVEDFNGYSCKRISDPVKNKVDPAIQLGGFSQQSWVQSSQADWNAGTFTASSSLSNTISPPYLTLSTGSISDGSTAGFGSGTFNSTVVSGGNVMISTNNVNVSNNGFETGSFTNWTAGAGVISSGITGTNCTLSPRTGTYMLAYGFNGGVAPTITASALECNDNAVLATVSFAQAANSCTYTLRTLSMTSYPRKCVYIIFSDATNSQTIAYSDQFYTSGTDITFYSASDNGSPVATTHDLVIDDVTNGKSTISSGTYTSRTIDTSVLDRKAIVLPGATFTASNIVNLNPNYTWSPSFVFQHSSDASSWQTLSLSTGTSILTNRYVRYVSTFDPTSSVGGSGNTDASLNSASFLWEPSSGAFRSQIHSFGQINSFGNFSVIQVLNGGSITYSMCSSANSGMSSAQCATQAINSQITVSTGTGGSATYVQWYATYSVTGATQTPTLQSGTVQTFSGSAQVPMSSTVWDNRYWLSLTTTTADSANDAVLVLNKLGGWSVFDIHAGAFTQYKGSLYSADSVATGNIYLQNQAFADNGSAINSFVKTKSLSFGDLSTDKYLYAIYPSFKNLGACAVNFSYTVDGSTSAYALGSPLQSEAGPSSSSRLPLPIDSSHQDFFQSASFTIGTNDAVCGFQFYGFKALYRERPTQ